MCWFSYCCVTLLSKNYITVQYASLSYNWRNYLSAYYHRLSGLLKNVTKFPILYYEYDCNMYAIKIL